MSEIKAPKRNEVATSSTWNAESVYETPEEWSADLENLNENISGLEVHRDTYSSSTDNLLAAIEYIEQLQRHLSRLNVYASLSYSVDTQNPESARMIDQVRNTFGKVRSATAFLNPGLMAIGQLKLNEWVSEQPGLAKYTHYFYNLFRNSEHIRDSEVEQVLGALASPFSGPYSVFNSLTNADFSFKPASAVNGEQLPVTQSTIDAVLESPDRKARRTGWENYTDTYLAHKNALANLLSSSMKQNVFYTRARNFNSTLEAALFEHNIPVEVFHNLISTFKDNLPIWHRYWRLRRKALGVETLHPYDIWAPLVDAGTHITYPRAVELISSGLEPLGPEYASILQRGCTSDRWVDYAPNQGKAAGAFSSGAYDTHPFICMSYTDDVSSLSTLAHELGHSMHSYLTKTNQPFVYSRYSLFLAEVASNFHQAMVRAKLLAHAQDNNFRIAVLEEAMSNFHRYFFIMPTLARFELEMHQRTERGQGLNADIMNNVMADLFSEGYGEEMHVDRERVGITWAAFQHLYVDYYVFQYATGISAAHALSRRILNDVPGSVQDYLKFLSSGSSLYPLEALKAAGVDLAQPDAVIETFAVLSDYVSMLESLLEENTSQGVTL